MRVKDDSVDLTVLKPEISCLFDLIDDCYEPFNASAVITATTGGKHMVGSLHYTGQAIDLRVKNVGSLTYQVGLHAYLKRAINIKYPGLYDVLLEFPGKPNAHIHIEPSPKLLAQLAANVVPA